MIAWRIGLGLAFGRSRGGRWRQINVVVCSALFLLLVTGALALHSLSTQQDARAVGRLPVVSSSPSTSDLLLLELSDEWRGDTIAVIYLEPTSAAHDPVLPPGVPSLPTAGGFWVSPALDALADDNPALDARYDDRSVLSIAALATGGELTAYRSVTPGTLSQDGASILRREGGEFAGSGPVRRVSSFGVPDARLFEMRRSAGAMNGGLVAALVVPGLIVLAVGLGASSSRRSAEVALLRMLGSPKRFVATVVIAEACALAGVGFVLGSVIVVAAGPQLGQVPFAGREVLPGDLTVAWPALAGVVAGGSVLVAMLALATTPVLYRSASVGSRPMISPPAKPTSIRVAPLVLAAAAFVTGSALGGERQADLLLLGAVLTTIGLPLVLPLVIGGVGDHLAKSRSVAASVVGRTMAWDSGSSARPLLGLTAIIVLMTSASGYLAVAAFTERPTGLSQGAQAVTITGGEGSAREASHELQRALPDTVVAAFESSAAPGGDGSRLVLAARCTDVAAVVRSTCDPRAPFRLAPRTERQLAALLYFAGDQGRVTEVELVAAVGHGDLDGRPDPHRGEGADEAGHEHERRHTAVLAQGSLYSLDESARTAAMSTLPVSSVSSQLLSFQVASPLVGWIKGGVAAAASALMVACLLSLVDQQLAAGRRRTYLSWIGASPSWYRGLIAGMFLAPFFLATCSGLVVGSIVCRLLIRDISPMPWATITAIAAFIAATAIAGTIVVALTDARRVARSGPSS